MVCDGSKCLSANWAILLSDSVYSFCPESDRNWLDRNMLDVLTWFVQLDVQQFIGCGDFLCMALQLSS